MHRPQEARTIPAEDSKDDERRIVGESIRRCTKKDAANANTRAKRCQRGLQHTPDADFERVCLEHKKIDQGFLVTCILIHPDRNW
jgi:hypothetical protein